MIMRLDPDLLALRANANCHFYRVTFMVQVLLTTGKTTRTWT